MHLRRFLFIFFACCALGPPAVAQSTAKTFTLNAASQCAYIGTTGIPTVGISVTGTFSMTLQPQVAINGSTPQNSQVTSSASTTPQGTVTGPGIYSAGVGGYDYFQLCVSAYTSGSVTVILNPSPALNARALGGSGGGTVTSVTAGTGLTGGGSSGAVTVSLATPVSVANGGTGTASPSLIAGTNISISGSWPDQTVNSTAGGTVTSVTGTAPVASSGGNAPAISITGVTGEQGNGALLQLSTGSPGTNRLIKYDANGNTVNSQVSDDGIRPTTSPDGYDASTTGAYSNDIANNTTTGTTANGLACGDGTGKVIVCPFATSTTNAPIGTCIANCGTTGNATIAFLGFILNCFDNQSVALDYAVESVSVNGCLHDTGSTSLTAGQPNFLVWTANAGANTNSYYRLLTADDFIQASSGIVYPPAGLPTSTGTAWGSSITIPTPPTGQAWSFGINASDVLGFFPPGIPGRVYTGCGSACTDTLLYTDASRFLVYNNGAVNVALTVPQAGTTNFGNSFTTPMRNTGTGTINLTTTTSTFNGSGSTAIMPPGTDCTLDTIDNANWLFPCVPELTAFADTSAGGVAETYTASTGTFGTIAVVGTSAVSGTNNLVAKFTGTHSVGNSQITDDGTDPTKSPLGFDVSTAGGYDFEIANAGTTGTTALTATCDNGAGAAVVCPHTSSTTNQPLGFLVSGAGTTGNATLCNLGWCQVKFDNSTTARHYAIGSTTTDGQLHDAGTALTAGQANYFIVTANGGAGNAGYVRLLTADDFIQATPVGVYKVQVNGTTLTAGDTVNLNATTPADAGAYGNCAFATSKSGTTDSVSLNCDTAIGNAVAGVNPAVAVLAASTAPLTGTYVQVGGGIGDTFTITATGAFTLDGVAINTIGQRVLFKNQSTASQNGVYTATIVGSTGISPVFTRALDYDTPSDVNNTGAIPVQSGTVNTTTSWLLTSQVTSIGSAGSSLTYAQFSINPSTQVTSAAALANTQIVTGAGSQGIQTPSSAATLNSSGQAALAQVVVGSPTGGGEGTGTVNATGLYVNGVAVAVGSSGALVQLESHTASGGSTMAFTSCLSGTYQEYELHFRNLVPSNATGVALVLQFSTNGGSSYDTTSANYVWGTHYTGFNATGGDGVQYTSGSLGGMPVGVSTVLSSNTTYGGASGKVGIFNANSTSFYKQLTWQLYTGGAAANTDYTSVGGGAYLNNTAAVNAIQLSFSTGNLTSGTVVCYGVTP